jgi:hypothetical protein
MAIYPQKEKKSFQIKFRSFFRLSTLVPMARLELQQSFRSNGFLIRGSQVRVLQGAESDVVHM